MLFSLDTRFKNFINSNHTAIKDFYPLLLEVKDALEEHKNLTQQKQLRAEKNRVFLRKSLNGSLEIFLDQDADVFISGLPSEYSKSHCFIGSDLIDEMLSVNKYIHIDV